ncbi:hypothetical protein Ancab_034360 [Ancistrocladus abbreviatus]
MCSEKKSSGGEAFHNHNHSSSSSLSSFLQAAGAPSLKRQNVSGSKQKGKNQRQNHRRPLTVAGIKLKKTKDIFSYSGMGHEELALNHREGQAITHHR